jgi:hypothetical protein
MDERTPIAQSSVDSYDGNAPSATASSTMKTYNFILNKYRSEFERALVYDEKKDKKYQREMRKLQKEKDLVIAQQREVEEAKKKAETEDFKRRVVENKIVTSIY